MQFHIIKKKYNGSIFKSDAMVLCQYLTPTQNGLEGLSTPIKGV